MLSPLRPLMLVMVLAAAPAVAQDVGRQLLDQERFEEAIEWYGKQAAQDPDDLAARVGLCRARIGVGEAVEVLETTDDLEERGLDGATLAYLRGLALYAIAKRSLAEGSAGPLTGSQFEDAYHQLHGALQGHDHALDDAWLPLAESAWYAQDLETADEAAARAMRHDREDPEVHLVWGRVRFSRYAVALAEERPEEEREELWQGTKQSFELALELLRGTGRASDQAQAQLQLGHLHGWKQELDLAAKRYAQALAADPDRVDPNVVRSTLGPEAFARCMDAAVNTFAERHGEEDTRRATLLWWQGYAHLELEHWQRAHDAYTEAHTLWPEYLDTWYYRFRCARELGRNEAAIEALRQLERADPKLFDSLVPPEERAWYEQHAR